MKLKIETAQNCDREQLRDLLLGASEQLVGAGSQVLEPRLRWEGQPILLADAGLHPVLISFDPDSSETALLNGLSGVERLLSALPWINQVYEALQQQQRSARLVVVAPDFPPGASAVLHGCTELSLFRYRALSVNGESGVWLEQLNTVVHSSAAPQAAPQIDTDTLPPQASNDILPPLSDAESAYFQQL